MNEPLKGDVGVIVGRFQLHKLHDAHKELIQSVVDAHPKVIIILGLSPLKTTFKNPLDLEMRRQMIHDDFPNVNIVYVKNCKSDELWSKKVDEVIEDNLLPNQKPVLYGSRDSFIPAYSGKFPVVELASKRTVSASEIRNSITKQVMSSEKFRAGVIWATGNRFPICYTTVDIAIINWAKKEILLARKSHENLYRFVGGFSSTESASFEEDAKREVVEETGLEVSNLKYLGSRLIKDWRYEGEVDKIKTMLFCADYTFGSPKADDDIAEVRWFAFHDIYDELLVDEHRHLWKMLIPHLQAKHE